MSLRSRGRHKPPVPSVAKSSAPFLSLSFDAIRTSLNDLKDSTDIFPPLNSAAGAVLAVWDLADRLSTSDEHAEGLAWRAVCILDAIYNASGGGAGPVSAAVLDAIRTFVGLLREISAAMEEELKPGRLRLQKRESGLAQFVARLDATSEAFKIGSAAPAEEQAIPATPDQASELRTIQTVIRISHVSGGTGGSGGMGGREGGVGGPGYGPSFQAETIMIQNCPPEHERLEQSNIRLDTEVRVLRTVVLFGLSPVSRGYPSGCAGAL
ncbi:hypothetical protein DFH08DRAFT_156036 [Mycena albidolilacea]|uniref:Uncharacterized protein n=1 Tax=Mycena albidolilacea TaxID=1033008 RepID=A0AAD7ERI4_9AGAR|nr:hypothetical protein DFH08DRAFT_156036 [Mycena albidolilacea]